MSESNFYYSWKYDENTKRTILEMRPNVIAEKSDDFFIYNDNDPKSLYFNPNAGYYSTAGSNEVFQSFKRGVCEYPTPNFPKETSIYVGTGDKLMNIRDVAINSAYISLSPRPNISLDELKEELGIASSDKVYINVKDTYLEKFDEDGDGFYEIPSDTNDDFYKSEFDSTNYLCRLIQRINPVDYTYEVARIRYRYNSVYTFLPPNPNNQDSTVWHKLYILKDGQKSIYTRIPYNVLQGSIDWENATTKTELSFAQLKLRDENGEIYNEGDRISYNEGKPYLYNEGDETTSTIYFEKPLESDSSLSSFPLSIGQGEGDNVKYWCLKYNGKEVDSEYILCSKTVNDDKTSSYTPMTYDPNIAQYDLILWLQQEENDIKKSWYLINLKEDTPISYERYILMDGKYITISDFIINILKYKDDNVINKFAIKNNFWYYDNHPLCGEDEQMKFEISQTNYLTLQLKITSDSTDSTSQYQVWNKTFSIWDKIRIAQLEELTLDGLNEYYLQKHSVKNLLLTVKNDQYYLNGSPCYIQQDGSLQPLKGSIKLENIRLRLSYIDSFIWQISINGGQDWKDVYDENKKQHTESLKKNVTTGKLQKYWTLAGDWITQYNSKTEQWEKIPQKNEYQAPPEIYYWGQHKTDQTHYYSTQPKSDNQLDLDNDNTDIRIISNPYKILIKLNGYIETDPARDDENGISIKVNEHSQNPNHPYFMNQNGSEKNMSMIVRLLKNKDALNGWGSYTESNCNCGSSCQLSIGSYQPKSYIVDSYKSLDKIKDIAGGTWDDTLYPDNRVLNDYLFTDPGKINNIEEFFNKKYPDRYDFLQYGRSYEFNYTADCNVDFRVKIFAVDNQERSDSAIVTSKTLNDKLYIKWPDPLIVKEFIFTTKYDEKDNRYVEIQNLFDK